MILVIPILLFGALLQTHRVAAKEYHLDFRRYCRLYKNLETFKFEIKLFYDGIYSETRYHLLLLKHQGWIRSRAQSSCKDPGTYFKTECLFLKREQIANVTDWSLLFRRKLPFQQLYFDLWLLHPALRYCQQVIGRRLDPSEVKKKLLAALSGSPKDSKIQYLVNAFSHTKQPWPRLLVQEIDELCGRKDSDAIFCTDLLEIVRLADAFNIGKGRGRFDSQLGYRWKAYRLHFAMIQQGNPTLYSSIISLQESKAVLEQNLDKMFFFMNREYPTKLREMVKMLPQKAAIYSCSNHLFLPRIKRSICIFWNVLSQICEYFRSSEPLKGVTIKKMLNTRIDYTAFLGQTHMKEILSTVQNQNTALADLSNWVTNEVKKDTKKRFKGVKTYFQQVSSFNRRKASADISFIKDRLDSYKTAVTSLSAELSGKLGEIITKAFLAVSLELAEETAQVILAGAVLMNPLEKLFGGDSIGDYMDRSAKLADTITKMGQLTRASKSYEEIKKRTSGMATNFSKNAKFLENLNTLINIEAGKPMTSSQFATKREQFLSDYKKYDPKVKRPDLVATGMVYGDLVDACCDVILGLGSLVSGGVKAIVRNTGICPKTKEVAEKLFATFEEIYDFQFDLIEAMASYMSAVDAHNAAENIGADYNNLARANDKTTLQEVRLLTKYAYISYKLNFWVISESYCDVLTYKEGGKTPNVCKRTPRDISTSLISYVSPTCRNTEAYKDVPITSANNSQAFMKLSDLYAGYPVYFQVPSSQWLVDNKWISAKDKDAAIVLKKFEVFLPESSDVPRFVEVNAEVTGKTKFTTSSKVSYVITPKKEFAFQYNEGAGSEETCRQTSQVLNNPYGGNLPKLCRLNVDENNCQELLQKTPLFPSVYSRWKITMSGYENVKPKIPANADFKLKVGVKLCILRSSGKDQEIQDGHGKKIREQMRDKERESCPKPTDYWSVEKGQCVQCPKGSKPELDGYFCAKQQSPPQEYIENHTASSVRI